MVEFVSFHIYSHGDFTAIVDLPQGRHEYKFYVDGQWIHNPNEVLKVGTNMYIHMYCTVQTYMYMYIHQDQCKTFVVVFLKVSCTCNV